jgi:hypothetical protein
MPRAAGQSRLAHGSRDPDAVGVIAWNRNVFTQIHFRVSRSIGPNYRKKSSYMQVFRN